jgi:hypothetical protein
MPARQWPSVHGWRRLRAHRATRKAESIGRGAASWLTTAGGATLLWGLGSMIAVASRLRQSLRVARRSAVQTWYSVGLTTPSRETLLWALLVVAISVAVGFGVTRL